MSRPAIFLAVLVFVTVLTACSSIGQIPTPDARKVAAAAASPYDGTWMGQGTALDGRTITVDFIVQGGWITSFVYSYPRSDHLFSCYGIDYSVVVGPARPPISNGRFSKTFGPDLTASASFTSPSLATGDISIVWQGRPANRCDANLRATWTAIKQAQAAQTTTSAPVTVTWCGKNVDCRDLIFQLLIFGLVNGAILALNAIGVTVIYSTVRTLNLAHGDIYALTTAFVTSTINLIGLNLNWPAKSRFLILAALLIGSIVIGALLSLGVEELAFRPFRGRSKLAPLIASLGLSFILYQGALVWRTFQKSFIRGEHRSVPGMPEVPTDGIPNFFPAGNLLHSKIVFEFSDGFVLAAAILFVLITTYILSRTRLGRSVRAVAQNEELAQMIGVNRDGAIRRAFILGGALAGAAAFIFALYYARPFGSDGQESGLFAFAAALMGGIGSPAGALTSGLLLGAVSSFSDYFLTAQWTPVVLLGLLAGILVWRRGGLLGREEGMIEGGTRDSVVLTAPTASLRTRRWLVALFIFLVALPLISRLLGLGGDILLRGLGIFILLTLGLNILLGLAGVLDLGYATSFAVGGYAAAILTERLRNAGSPIPDFPIVALVSAVAAGIFGIIKGATATRLRGDYLAVATLALGLLAQQLITNGGEITGETFGLSALPPPYLFGLSLASPAAQYYLVLVFVLLAALVSGRLMASRTGRAWLAASEDETAAHASGVDAARYRMLAFAFSSALAGIAGALYASTFSYIDSSLGAFEVTSTMLAMVILGGAGSVTGAALGTTLVYFYDKIFVPQLFALLALLWPQGVYIGMVPDIRGTNYFDFGIVLYLTVLWRAWRRKVTAVSDPASPEIQKITKTRVVPSPRE